MESAFLVEDTAEGGSASMGQVFLFFGLKACRRVMKCEFKLL
jgi:hypothetical protein